MRSWRWRRMRTIPVDTTPGEATKARQRAEARWSRVNEVRAAHDRLLRENHFAERVRHALEGR